MIPYTYRMVDLRGVDLADSLSTTIPGLYSTLLEAISDCRTVVLYNWYFAAILIAPSYCEIEVVDNAIVINDLIEVSSDDTIIIPGLLPDPPVLIPISIVSNGEYSPLNYNADGFSFADVQIPDPTLEEITIDENGVYLPEEYGFSKVTVSVQQVSPLPPIPSLPQEYQEVEYIVFEGNDYITVPQNSSFYPYCEIGVKAEVDDPSVNQYICGYRVSSTSILDWNLGFGSGNPRWYIRAGSSFLQGYANKDEKEVTAGAIIPMSNDLASVRSAFYIGNYYTAPGSTANLPFSGKLKYLYALKNVSNTWQSYYAPCYRKADNVIGLYDVVNSIFLTSQNGLLGKGPNKEV